MFGVLASTSIQDTPPGLQPMGAQVPAAAKQAFKAVGFRVFVFKVSSF